MAQAADDGERPVGIDGMPDALCWQNTAGMIRTSGWRAASEGT